MRHQTTEARLLYTPEATILTRIDPDALGTALAAIGAPVDHVEGTAEDGLTLCVGGLRISLTYVRRPISIARLRDNLPTGSEFQPRRELLTALARHGGYLRIAAHDACSAAMPVSTAVRQRVLWQIVDHLVAAERPEAVQTPGERMLTGAEAAGRLHDLLTAARPLRPEDLQPIGIRRNIFEHAPHLSPLAFDWLDAAEPEVRSAVDRHVAAAAGETPLPSTPAGRSALYVMSATIAVFALPLGASALAYNALSGGSLRATAYMMTGTGLASMLDSVGVTGTAKAALALL